MAKFPNSSLAELYDEVTMPYELRQAHRSNDRKVAATYVSKISRVRKKLCK